MTSRAQGKPEAESEGRGTRKALVEAHIIEAATTLFAERGFAGTSLQDIATATGLTRPALYHYFASKEALLSRLVSAATEAPAGDLRLIRRRDATCVDRLRAMAASIVELQTKHPARFRVLIMSEAELPAELAKTYASGRRSVLREFSTVIDEGVRAGEFRAVDPRTAALGIIGICNWVAWWHRPGSDSDDQRVVRELAEMAVASIAVADRRKTAAGSGIGRAIELLKHDLATLELLVEPPDSAR